MILPYLDTQIVDFWTFLDPKISKKNESSSKNHPNMHKNQYKHGWCRADTYLEYSDLRCLKSHI